MDIQFILYICCLARMNFTQVFCAAVITGLNAINRKCKIIAFIQIYRTLMSSSHQTYSFVDDDWFKPLVVALYSSRAEYSVLHTVR